MTGPSSDPASVSTFLAALTEAAVPADGAGGESGRDEPGLNDAERDRALGQTAAFLRDQLASLPADLRWLFAIGTFGFRCLVVLRYGRGFAALTPERRRRVFNAWAYGPIGVARQLFRPVRSIVLLGWYEGSESAGRPR